jgi:choline-sulfatase
MSRFSRREVLALPAALAAPAPRPNILFFFPDQHRYDWIAGGAIDVRTPNLDALRKRGVNFTRAATASPLCAPARACLAAGKEYDRARVPSNRYDYPLDQPAFYQLLRDSGYHTMACGKVDMHKKTMDWGLDGKRLTREWGFSDAIDNEGKGDAISSGAVAPKGPFMAMLHRRGLAQAHVADLRNRKNYSVTTPCPLPEDAYCDNWLSANGLDLLRRAPAGRPWFLQINFVGPHNPMDITPRMEATVRGRSYPAPHHSTLFTPAIHQAIRQNYTAMVENIDRQVGVFLEEVRRRGELDNTLVVFSSDHGEMLGDHDRWGKHVPYRASTDVPLIVAGPGVRARGNSPALVSTMDLAATFLEAGGLPVPQDMDSRSLKPLLEGRARSHREFLHSGLEEWRTVSDGRFKLVRGFGKQPLALWDWQADAQESRDFSAERPDVVRRLSALLPAPAPA